MVYSSVIHPSIQMVSSSIICLLIQIYAMITLTQRRLTRVGSRAFQGVKHFRNHV
ncbi:unnamed protein product [Meloidogyne enterolobii]|uniref:Uncharacterized protein n=1 Tax=Meloidogyne enterolobii TaxID=390850 RepID=A0ACB0Z7Q7_MELEN